MNRTKRLEVLSGDGDSPESPIEFEASDRNTRISSEGEYISAEFGEEGIDWDRGPHFTRLDGLSQWVIELADGSTRSVYFDLSSSEETE